MFLQQSANPLYVPFNVLEYYVLVMKYINNNIETINAEKQELNCLNFVYDSQFAYVQLPYGCHSLI